MGLLSPRITYFLFFGHHPLLKDPTVLRVYVGMFRDLVAETLSYILDLTQRA
jgi:hypothetical protein